MSRFLKFSNRILNTAFIKHVEIDNNAKKFTIYLSTRSMDGLFLLGSGSVSTETDIVYACQKEHPDSYAIVEKWINSLKCVSNDNNK